ncbi:MAG: PQQ-dependent sugar dehydrogenase [Saprospiraceae bacterium]|nr:PQQ-dependent sugar dehydrogenase [Saprospiraceae bacterium]
MRKKFIRTSYLLLSALLVFFEYGCAQQYPDLSVSDLDVSIETISTDFQVPWSFTFLPGGDLLITEKEGQLFRLTDGVKEEITGMPDVYVRGQGGLLDIEVHPHFEENQYIYFTYGSSSSTSSGGNTTLMRAKLVDNHLEEQKVIFKALPESTKGQHWGGRIAFDPQGYLFLSVGDRGDRDENPQSLNNHCGKIHRIFDDGRIPPDNPFVHRSGAIASIFSYGHRNPQGMAVHPETGEIWTHEHGPQGGDELNVIRKGNNYGWPVITYGINYNGTKITDLTSKPGMEQPATYWVPSIAPCGMTFVTSDRYPEWKGSILLGSLKFMYIHRVVLDVDKVVSQEKVLDRFGRIRSIKQSPDGYLYFSAEGKGIFRINPLKKG